MNLKILLAALTLAHAALGIDLCIFFNTCRKPKNAITNTPTDRAGETSALKFDDDWIESEFVDNRQLYHFANNVGRMDWFQAERYCENKGGFLAEPFTAQEHQFLRGQARQFPNAIWWIGLREALSCRCQPFGRSGNPFEAQLDQDSLFNPNGGYVKSTCPNGFTSICSGTTWRWASSGANVGSTQWNPQTNEPNGASEHCVGLWPNGNYNWLDWECTKVADASQQDFKPLCQKDKLDGVVYTDEDDYVYEDEADKQPRSTDDYEETDDYADSPEQSGQSQNLESNGPQCVEVDVKFAFRRDDKIDAFGGVSTYQDCQRQCADNPNCRFWIWKGNGKNKRCIFAKALRPRNNRISKAGFVSGAMTDECASTLSLPTPDLTRDADHCVEYGALYRNGDNQLRVILDVETLEDCKQNCKGTSGCQFFSWNGKSQRKQCRLFSFATFEVIPRRNAISGSITGNCRDATFREMQACECSTLAESAKLEEESDDEEDYDYRDLVGEGLIDVRLNVERSLSCQGRRTVQQCSVGPSVDPVAENDSDYCVEYDVLYQQGTKIDSVKDVQSAEECKQTCLQLSGCRFFSWNGGAKNKRCTMFADADFDLKFRRGAVSGSVENECRSGQLGDMQQCTCVDLNETSNPEGDDEEDDYDYRDLVGSGLIDVRLNDPSSCPKRQARRCSQGQEPKPPTPRNEDYCVEYNALYTKGRPIPPVETFETLEACRTKCSNTKACNFFSWNGNAKQKKCFLFTGMDFELKRRRGATSGTILGECGSLSFNEMQKCDCINLNELVEESKIDPEDDYEDRDLVGEGLIDVRLNTGETKDTCGNQIRRCSKGQEEEFVEKDVCADYNTDYRGGGVIQRFNRIPNEDVCRARCIQTEGCQYWTYKGSIRQQTCLLMSGKPSRMRFQSGFVSGSLIGECQNLALSQLNECECYNHENDEKAIGPTVRTKSEDDCPVGIGLRCYAENADVIVSRIFFGN